jgi:hypothetical protein
MDLDLTKKQCDAILQATVGSALVELWWHSGNRAFEGRTPAQQWQQDPGSVHSYLMTQMSGGYS